MTNTLRLIEKPYVSIQGEGQFVGIPMLFVRLQGCNVGCKWCDSMYTWAPYEQDKVPNSVKDRTPEAFDITFSELDKLIEESGVQHVWITGGEPMLHAEALGEYFGVSTSNALFHICTSGMIFDRKVARYCDYITIDVKASSSGVQRDRVTLAEWVHARTHDDIELKMVVANNEKDRAFAIETVSLYGDKAWTLQPLYYSEPAVNADPSRLAELNGWGLAEFASWVNDNFRQYESVRMGLQLHKHIWPRQSRGI